MPLGKKNASDHFGSTILKFCACVPRLGLNNFLLADIPYLAVRAVVTKPFEIFYVRQLNLHAKRVINLFNNFWDSFLILEPLDSRTLCLFHFFLCWLLNLLIMRCQLNPILIENDVGCQATEAGNTVVKLYCPFYITK